MSIAVENFMNEAENGMLCAGPTSQRAVELVADYIRASGVRNPNQIATLANDCVMQAERDAGDDAVAVAEMALKLASAQLGLACAPSEGLCDQETMAPNAETLRAEDVMPPCNPRVMPEQKLDELLPIAEPDAWRKLVRAGAAAIAFVMAKVRLV